MAETVYCLAVYRQSLPTSELVQRADVGRISGHSSSQRGFSLFHGCVTLACTRAHVRTGLVFLVHLAWCPQATDMLRMTKDRGEVWTQPHWNRAVPGKK